MTAAVVIGQSHVNAIAEAVAARGAERRSSGEIKVYRLESKGGLPEPGTLSTDEAVALVAQLPPSTPVFLSILGTYHNILGLLRSGEDFDYLLDRGDAERSLNGTQVPHRAIAAAFESVFEDSNAVKRLAAACRSPLYLLSVPPPKECNAFILESFMRQKKPVYRGKSVEDVGIESPERRVKLWLLESRLLERWAQSQQMRFIPPPTQAMDERSFLKRDFYGHDVTHANAAYGGLVIEQIEEILKQEEEYRLHA